MVATLCAVGPPAAPAAHDPLRPQQWGLDMIKSDAARGLGATGAGAMVAVVDSGVRRSHADLAGPRLLLGRDVVAGGEVSVDEHGHGTHVTGIIAASESNDVGVASVAPGAMVLPVRVLDRDGFGSNDQIADGIRWAVDRGAHVINLSLGEDLPSLGTLGLTPGGVFDQAVDYALDRGRVVVAAAGNSGLPACEQPSGGGRLLCVGAVDRSGLKSHYSSFGRGLAITAPGGTAVTGSPTEDILSTYIGPDDYRALGGTSQAAAHVSGVAALLVGRGLRGQDVVHRILATATDAGVKGPDALYGAGIVNARDAVASTLAGGSGSGPGAGLSAGAYVSVRRVQRIATVLRRGVLVRCRAAGAGRCAVRVRAGRRTLAAGSAAVVAGRTATVRARVTRRGRGVLRRVRTRLRATVRVSLPGAGLVTRRIQLRR